MWRSIVERGRPRKIIWRMRIACWITKSTNTHSDYLILIAFPVHQLLQERPLMFRHSTFPNTCLSQLLSLNPNQFIFPHCSTIVQVRCNMFRPSALCLFSSFCCLPDVNCFNPYVCVCMYVGTCV